MKYPWSCKYCKHKNAGERATCGGCGYTPQRGSRGVELALHCEECQARIASGRYCEVCRPTLPDVTV